MTFTTLLNLGSATDVQRSQIRRFAKLCLRDPDTAEAVKWVRLNQDRFEKEVIEPPCLSLHVPERQYANAIEACFERYPFRVSPSRCH